MATKFLTKGQRAKLKKYVPKHSPEFVKAAFSLYLSGTPIEAIGIRLNQDAQTIRKWRNDFEWDRFRREAIGELQANVAKRYVDFQNEHFDEVVGRQHQVSSLIDAHLIKTLDTRRKISADNISKIARAASSSSDISARLVGLNKMSDERTKPMLVQVNVNVRPDVPEPSATSSEVNVTAESNGGYAPGTEPF